MYISGNKNIWAVSDKDKVMFFSLYGIILLTALHFL